MALKTSDNLSVVTLSEPGARVYIDQVGRSRRPIRYEDTDSGDLTYPPPTLTYPVFVSVY